MHILSLNFKPSAHNINCITQKTHKENTLNSSTYSSLSGKVQHMYYSLLINPSIFES